MKKGGHPALHHSLLRWDKTPAMKHARFPKIRLALPVYSLRRMAVAGCAAVLTMLSACSSGHAPSNVQVGPIVFTDVNGAPLPKNKIPGSLTAGQGTYVDVTLSGDPQELGADWSVYCGSAPAPGTPVPPGQTQDETCGTFTPAHTLSGPIPTFLTSATGYVALYVAPSAPPKDGTVTLYAASTSAANKFSSVSLSIDGNPISVSLAPPPPGSLTAGTGTQLRAVLNNDPANAGVKWTVICGSTDCGSFAPAQTGSGIATTYTAPAVAPVNGVVQVTATSVTDPTKAASATISIM
ncbi:hypothetical protein HNQ77_003666 [Silvibacterium bohemicum]|uniref:Uncharacterized protein n=1 Tax=Silvibacterium bohemicum TaxID=1577686 RepID=A0A841JYK0_9BACT|nr:hypothetical protein [Silvibacterium bohemicum]MBB6145705.1 hypothetical protein [Silvibacterium bohemicum]